MRFPPESVSGGRFPSKTHGRVLPHSEAAASAHTCAQKSAPVAAKMTCQTRCQSDANSKQKRNAKNERTIMFCRTKTLKGYSLQNTDRETIGKVKEFYFDDRHWTIRYLVADTGNWLTGRQVLISPYSLVAVNKEKRDVSIDLTKKQIEDSPSLDSDKPVSRQFEPRVKSLG